MSLKNQIKKFRNEKIWTQSKLAEKTNLMQKQISAYFCCRFSEARAKKRTPKECPLARDALWRAEPKKKMGLCL